MGLDGGGTHTRVLVCTTQGAFLGSARNVGCNPEFRPVGACVTNARAALQHALAASGVQGMTIRAFVAGIAGLTYSDDGAWAQAIIADLAVGSIREFVGDNVVAQNGAFGGAPGIVACAGTGSIVYGVSEAQHHACNFDFNHTARAGAPWLCHDLLVRIAAMEARPADAPLVEAVLAQLKLADLQGFRKALVERSAEIDVDALAPLITTSALRGSPLARATCNAAASHLAQGVRLLGPYFTTRPVAVAPIGSVACSPYMQRALGHALASPIGAFRFTLPLYPPVVGALILAARMAGEPLSCEATRELTARVSA